MRNLLSPWPQTSAVRNQTKRAFISFLEEDHIFSASSLSSKATFLKPKRREAFSITELAFTVPSMQSSSVRKAVNLSEDHCRGLSAKKKDQRS
jgi:hypothetical protein